MINNIKYRFHIYNVRYHIFLIGIKLKLYPKLSSILSYDSDLLKLRKSLSKVMYKNFKLLPYAVYSGNTLYIELVKNTHRKSSKHHIESLAKNKDNLSENDLKLMLCTIYYDSGNTEESFYKAYRNVEFMYRNAYPYIFIEFDRLLLKL